MEKLRYAYGICSYVKGNRSRHYLLVDSDSNFDAALLLKRFDAPTIYYETPHGYHAIVFKPLSFYKALSEMVEIPFLDRNFLAVGLKRGYWFLETQVPLFLPNLTYMRIERI